MTPHSFELIAGLLRGGSSLAIGPDKIFLLETRLAPILTRHGIADLDALAERLRPGAGGERASPERAVIEAMTINESFFFRDEKPFAHVRMRALPMLLAVRPAGAQLRIWSAAASTGQEAYSLAMILTDFRAQMNGRSVEIIGTDLSREALARAQAGLYTQFEVQRELPMQYLAKYIRRDGLHWRIADGLQEMVAFREWNLLGDLGALGQFDIVFCRNVLIYFDQPTKSRVLDAIVRQMAPDGRLYLGGAETMIGLTDRLAPVPGEAGVYAPAAMVRAA
ncbi:MAG TPA: protein-glutamate O-methyltransferase CheR [Acetobacteraceae bacterium]|jgi:chemotaxis protein methyltransferase CheR